MLISGCANSLLTKLQDNQCVGNCGSANLGDHKTFEQPVLQSVQMFFAEAGCWLIYYLIKRYSKTPKRDEYESIATGDDEGEAVDAPTLKGWKLLLLGIPAFCDVCGTTLMQAGLLFVPVSIYQMTRGSVVLFVGSFSVLFLKHKISVKQWLGLVGVLFGVFLVGVSASLGGKKKADSVELEDNRFEVVIGMFMILFGQLFTATQFVFEEHILTKFSLDPLKVVAWEGTFGSIITISLSIIIYIILTIFGHDPGIFDLLEGLRQMFDNKTILYVGFAIMISIAAFNFCGLSVTKQISATSRSTIDTSRTLGIWIVS